MTENPMTPEPERSEVGGGELIDWTAEMEAERMRLCEFFVREGDKVKQRRVETGVSDNTYIEVKNGVKVGEEVVSGSYAAISRTLKDGSKILVEKPKKDDNKS